MMDTLDLGSPMRILVNVRRSINPNAKCESPKEPAQLPSWNHSTYLQKAHAIVVRAILKTAQLSHQNLVGNENDQVFVSTDNLKTRNDVAGWWS